MNLILAIVWFTLGVWVLIWEWTTGDTRFRLSLLGNVSACWIAFPMSLFSLARWYSEVSARRERARLHQAEARRFLHHAREHESARPIDPTFDFTSEPPPPPQTDVTDQPPSKN